MSAERDGATAATPWSGRLQFALEELLDIAVAVERLVRQVGGRLEIDTVKVAKFCDVSPDEAVAITERARVALRRYGVVAPVASPGDGAAGLAKAAEFLASERERLVQELAAAEARADAAERERDAALGWVRRFNEGLQGRAPDNVCPECHFIGGFGHAPDCALAAAFAAPQPSRAEASIPLSRAPNGSSDISASRMPLQPAESEKQAGPTVDIAHPLTGDTWHWDPATGRTVGRTVAEAGEPGRAREDAP